MLIEEEILSIAKQYFNLTENEIKLSHRLKGGMSNYTYLIHVNEEPFVVRVIGEKGEVIVDPKKEKKHLDLVKPLNVTSETLYFDEKSGHKISRFIEGEVLSQDIEEKDYIEVVKKLKTLHHSTLVGYDYELKDRLRRYEKLLKNLVSQKYYMLKMSWLKLYDDVYSKDKKVFCHGDAQRSNLIRTTDSVELLDFEFAGMNDYYYDIASFGNMSFNDSIRLLGFYLEHEPHKDELNKLRFYRMYQVLQWHIVASYKHEVGLSEKLNLDFEKIAKKYLDMAEQFYTEMME